MSEHKYAVAEWLHLYPQSHWHDEAHIVGTREGLLALRAALDAALTDDHGHYGVTVFANDGEGYCVGVACVPLSEMERMATPYTDEVARGRGGYVAVAPAAKATSDRTHPRAAPVPGGARVVSEHMKVRILFCIPLSLLIAVAAGLPASLAAWHAEESGQLQQARDLGAAVARMRTQRAACYQEAT